MDGSEHNGQLCGTRHASDRVETALTQLDQMQRWHHEKYRVTRHPQVQPGEDRWTCTCKGYHYRSKIKLNYYCKHITKVREWLIKKV